ncbi:hypothetical protein JCM10213_001227 [Rhodosporidiobolus nylandii]
MAPTIDVFVTSIMSNPAIRGRHERVKRALTGARVAYSEHDVAGDEQAKQLWKRKNGGKNELPFLLVDGEPVGSIEDLDEAVEFGELRQFLRLDTPSAPSPAAAPAPPSASNAAAPPSSAVDDDRPKPTLDDFASLDLSAEELAELERELAAGETFSSGLGSSHANSGQGYDFSTTQRFEPLFSPTAPLKLEKVNFVRPLPDRPLASEVVRDELEGIDADEIGEDELEKLARELEAEEEERRRLRDAQGDAGRGVEPPPLPEKQPSEGAPKSPELPAKDAPSAAAPPPQPSAKGELAEKTSVEGAGGAELSAPLKEVEKLRLDDDVVASLSSDLPSEGKVEVASPASPSAPSPNPATPEADSARPLSRTTPSDAAALKAELHKAVSGSDDADPERLAAVGGSMRVTELPEFVSASPEEEKVEVEVEEVVEEPQDGLADRVAEAIRGGDL